MFITDRYRTTCTAATGTAGRLPSAGSWRSYAWRFI
jgi:hypothetical protein